ncbi:hypothetical protein ACE0DR_28020 [Azotobacter sp. CWF10]
MEMPLSDRPLPRLDPQQVDQYTQKFLSRAPHLCLPSEVTRDDLVDAICDEWGKPEAALLGRTWLSGDNSELEEVHMETQTMVELVAAAATAAFLALVLLARRNATVKLQGRELRVSEDFSALQKVRDQGGPAAGIAHHIIESELSPWSFDLEYSLLSLPIPEQRTLLVALAPLDVSIELITPAPGDPFDLALMCSSRFMDDGCHWVVSAPTGEDRLGFRLRGKLLAQAEVDACTADWWCLALADTDCPVASAVKADPDQYIGLDSEYVACWSVMQGFSAFADLRNEFDEATLAIWAAQFRERLSNWYPAASGRIPVVFGGVNDRFDPSVMKAVDGAHDADARVVELEERDGLPQVGLGCVGAPPLLYALVRIEEC